MLHPIFNRPLFGRNVATGVFGWMVFLVYQTVYCAAFQEHVLQSDDGLSEALAWVLREWGLWLGLTPLLIWLVHRLSDHFSATAAWMIAGSGALGVMLSYRVGLEISRGNDGVLGTVVYFTPQHIAAVLAMALGWIVLPGGCTSAPAPEKTRDLDQPSRREQHTLLVTKGSAEALLRVADIESISAAGNYIELSSKGDTFLMRGALSSLQQQLPGEQFVQIHRSHIVNIDAVDTIETSANGNGHVRLKDGRSLSLSKRCARELRQRHRVSCEVRAVS